MSRRSGWRVLPFQAGQAEALLAEGLARLDALAEDPTPTLRWYRSTTPAIVLGRGQALDVRPDATGQLAVATRFSGGGAVLLDDAILSLDVLLPAGHPLLDGDLGAVFDRVGAAWAGALRALGVRDVAVWDRSSTARRRGGPRERLLAAVCYATLGRGEVVAGGRKLVGLAQRRRRPGALVQCGMLRRWRPGPLLEALGADPLDRDIAERAIGLDDLVDLPPGDGAIMTAVQRELAGTA